MFESKDLILISDDCDDLDDCDNGINGDGAITLMRSSPDWARASVELDKFFSLCWSQDSWVLPF